MFAIRVRYFRYGGRDEYVGLTKGFHLNDMAYSSRALAGKLADRHMAECHGEADIRIVNASTGLEVMELFDHCYPKPESAYSGINDPF